VVRDKEFLMTTLDPTAIASRKLPWSALRLAAGALLLLLGLLLLLYAWRNARGDLVGLGVILTGLGLATSFESTAEQVLIPVAAIVVSLIPFGLFLALVAGKNPFTIIKLMYDGSFGSWFAFQNTLTRAAPLMLTGLCTALPMRVGLVVIGGEGALVIGALIAAGTGHYFQVNGASSPFVVASMLLAAALSGGLWLALAGALKHYRGVNETISSLLLIYIGIALMNQVVEGPWRDPASLNKPSTWPLNDAQGNMLLGTIGTMDVHYGLLFGLAACFLCWILMNHTTFGFSARVVGGNIRAAKVAGLSLGRIILITCALAGAAAGLAGGIEVAAVQGSANATLVAGYGYTGILVAFLARQNPLGIIPVAILLGGIAASGGLLQRRAGLPDATVNFLQGTLFLIILATETYYGRFPFFQKKEASLG
jgi:simple sugar transport system permease protein